MSDSGTYVESAKGGPGGWGPERLSKIPEYKLQIVELIASGLFISEICQQIGITPPTVRKWRAEDKEFDEAYSDAEAQVTDTLEKEAIRRARNGVLEPVVSGGKVVMDPANPGEILQVRRYSDGLMQFLLKGRRREVYGDKREISAQVGIDVVGAKSSLEAKFAAAAAVITEGTTE